MVAGASIAEIVRALQTLHMRLYDELAPRLSTAPPTKQGFYAWWQIPEALPGVPGTAHPSAELELLYVGIAPKEAVTKSNQRKRLANHHPAAIGSSTFRLDLIAFLWEACGWQPFWTDRPNLTDENLAELAEWQRKHRFVQWRQVPEPWLLEPQVVAATQPPLNRDHNAAHPFHREVGWARDRLRAASRTRPG